MKMVKSIKLFMLFVFMFSLQGIGADNQLYASSGLDDLNIIIDRKDSRWEQDRRAVSKEQEIRETEWDISLKNTGGVDLENITVELCEYVVFKTHNGEYVDAYTFGWDDKVVRSGSTEKISTWKSRSIRHILQDRFITAVGVRVRVTKVLPDGTKKVIEESSPELLPKDDFPWKERGEVYSPNLGREKKCFLNDWMVVLSGKSYDSSWKFEAGGTEQTENRLCRKTDYEITIQNNSNARFNGIRAAYKIFYKKFEHSVRGSKHSLVTTSGAMSFGSLEPEEIQRFSIQDAVSEKSEMVSRIVEGVWVRVYLPLNDGREVWRDIRIPEDLEVPLHAPLVFTQEEFFCDLNPKAAETVFLDDSLVTFSVDKKVLNKRKISEKNRQDVQYGFTLENKSDVDLLGVFGRSHVFVEFNDNGKKLVQSKYQEILEGDLLAGQTQEGLLRQQTEIPSLRSVVGVRFEIFLPMADGRQLMREVYFPKELAESDGPWKGKQDDVPSQIEQHQHSTSCSHARN